MEKSNTNLPQLGTDPNPNPNPNPNLIETLNQQHQLTNRQQLHPLQHYLHQQFLQQQQRQQQQPLWTMPTSMLGPRMSASTSMLGARMGAPINSSGYRLPQQHTRVSGGGIRIGSSARPPLPPPTLDQVMAVNVTGPHFPTPFAPLHDAAQRLLPIHVVAHYDAEEGNVEAKTEEFSTALEKQIQAFNLWSEKASEGELRSEERLAQERALLEQETQALADLTAELARKEAANREAIEAQMRLTMAQAERARAMARAQEELQQNAEFFRGFRNAVMNDEFPSELFVNNRSGFEIGESSAKGGSRGADPFDSNNE